MKKLDELIAESAKKLPDTPRWIQLQSVDGIAMTNWGEVYKEMAAAMTAACNALCERTLMRSGNGDFRRSIMFGTRGVFVVVRLNNDQDALSMSFDEVESVDKLLVALDDIAASLNVVLADISSEK